jgi:alkylation response protein AidB-like acyl-CoA dehydrogenase
MHGEAKGQSVTLRELRERTEGAVNSRVAQNAEGVDAECSWPADSLNALAEAGLLGLHVPVRFGGLEQGMEGLVTVTETIAKACSSTALCYAMHCVGTAVIAAKATTPQIERYLKPIAAGKHITTLALSEGGTGAHFYLPQTRLEQKDGTFCLDGTKEFVTNGGHADSYVVSTVAAEYGAEPGEFSCVLVDRDVPGVKWTGGWRGLGMRGNASQTMQLKQVNIVRENLLGERGDQVWYVFEVVAPYFLTAMAATYLGIATTALDSVVDHVKLRKHTHSGESLAELSVVQRDIARLWSEVERTRLLIYDAARLGDLGSADALPSIFAAKIAAAETATLLTNEAMTLAGGIAYRENSRLARLLRDARAAHVMSPTTGLLKQWLGRTLLDLPLF